tara:strand:+ start:889 stop:1032 length:144 start_codon:yes stop_codon:yes gene_type:complete
MKRQNIAIIIRANDDRPSALEWLRDAIENDLQEGEEILDMQCLDDTM